MTEKTKRGIAVIAGIANTAHSVNQTFSKEQLNQLLELFEQRPNNDDREYVEPGKLVLLAYDKHYDDGDPETSEHIKRVFIWFNPDIDRSLLN